MMASAIVLAVTATTASVWQTESAGQCRFTTLQLETCPLRILQLTHSSTDLASHAKVRNQTMNRIQSYRMGWIALFHNASSKITLGKIVNIGGGLRPGEVTEMPAQKIAVIPGATEVRFFVAEASWQGGFWKANLKEIEADALDNNRRKPRGTMSDPGEPGC